MFGFKIILIDIFYLFLHFFFYNTSFLIKKKIILNTFIILSTGCSGISIHLINVIQLKRYLYNQRSLLISLCSPRNLNLFYNLFLTSNN